jgi:rRNA maturation endonuclease Nob1
MNQVDLAISGVLKKLRIKDMTAGKLRCPGCKSVLRYSQNAGFGFCPKCLKELR